ncbi:type VI secretion system Vgr family protein [Citrobacter arsenatis]|uniref:type VI secretion system Vgr family protein n=1 Tax=Citrobacter arsenatis TaxID=2546350 RepID=UPI00300E3D48
MLTGQENRFIRFTGVTGNSLVLLSISGEEQLSESYLYNVNFTTSLSTDDVYKFLGQDVAFEIGMGTKIRYVHGIFTEICEQITEDGLSTFSGRIEPHLALLKAGSDMAVYQNITVPDLVCKLLSKNTINCVELRLNSNYQPREYCIQYRESDYNFINRMLECEGIFYYFEHSATQHTLVLTDYPSSPASSISPVLPWIPFAGKSDEGVLEWYKHNEMTSESVQLRAFNVEQAAPIEVECRSQDSQHILKNINYIDMHSFTQREQLQKVAQLKMEYFESHAQYANVEFYAWWLNAGESFTLTSHPSSNGEYCIRALSLQVNSNIIGDVPDFKCLATVFDKSLTWRPAPKTPVPCIAGILTATVVGPGSEEIHVDDYGRIKIQFPWDTINRFDDSSSCWIRVSQIWSGNNFGSLFLPRIGSEVIISFINGHPDYPIVTGSVFNGKNKPSLTLPASKTCSGFISRSTLGGNIGEGNKLLFEDKKGEELVSLNSQKDMQLTVLNNLTSDISKMVKTTIGENRTVEINKGNDDLTLRDGSLNLTLEKGNMSTQLKQGDINLSLQQGDYSLSISGGGKTIKTDKKVSIESMQSIELKVGNNKITISSTGVSISATTVKIEGSGTTEINGAMTSIKGSGTTQISGGVVMIG